MADTMNPLVKEARDLSAKATPGPWTYAPSVGRLAPSIRRADGYWLMTQIGYGTDADAEMVARYRTLCLELADAVERLEREAATDAPFDKRGAETVRLIDANATLLQERDEAREIAKRFVEHRTRPVMAFGESDGERVCVADCPKCIVAAWTPREDGA